MKTIRLLAATATLAALGCSKDAGPFEAEKVPLAYTRFVNAVPDTSAMDYRFVDQVEYSPITLALAFRSFSPYQGTGTGARHIRVFTTSTDINVTTKIVLDTTYTFEANTYYTIVHYGYARTGQTPADQFLIIKDSPPDAGGNVAVRALNLGTGLGSVDLFTSAAGGSDPLPASPTFSNVAYGSVTTYNTRPTGALVVRATAAGTRTPVLADVTAPAGLAADPGQNLTAVGGSGQAGSALVAILMPRSVAGSAAPQTTAFQSPTIVYVVDKNPPR